MIKLAQVYPLFVIKSNDIMDLWQMQL